MNFIPPRNYTINSLYNTITDSAQNTFTEENHSVVVNLQFFNTGVPCASWRCSRSISRVKSVHEKLAPFLLCVSG